MRFEIFVLYFLTALLALEGMALLLRRRADPVKVRKRLRTLAQKVAQTDLERSGSIIRGAGGRWLPSLAGLEVLLYRAGGPLTRMRFYTLSVVLAMGAFSTLLVLTNDPLRSIPALPIGLIVPWLFVRRLAAKRSRRFDEQLPDALDLMTRSLRTSHGLAAGFQMVNQEFDDPIGAEFGLVAEEVGMGLEIREALENLMHRVDNESLSYFKTAVLIQRQTGGNLAELMDKLGTLLRERSQFHGRVRALTAQGRGAATFLALWLPFIIIVIWVVAPGYLTPLFEHDWGYAILAGALGIDAFAYFISLRIADVEA